jgi:hypothetical protein
MPKKRPRYRGAGDQIYWMRRAKRSGGEILRLARFKEAFKRKKTRQAVTAESGFRLPIQ